MSFETILFWAFSGVLVAAALGVILLRNPVHAALALVLAFVTAAAHWLLLRAEFLAITLVLVYVGAVMVLFLFVVMMLDINVDQLREGFMKFLAAGLLVGGVMVAEMVAVFVNAKFFGAERLPAPPDPGPGYSNTKELGRVLYTDYVYPFELAAVLLLVAIIAAIALTMRKRKDSKFQNPAEQVAVRREDRIKLVSMPAEKAGE
ncbi:MAG: NADH-quinone oxidoreductase subunit J [Burkholderiales bacterium]